MKVEKIYIEGFRSIKEPLILNLKGVNALIGANNSGKSNILLALYKVLGRNWVTKNAFESQDVYKEDINQDIKIDIVFEEPYKYEQFKGFEVEIPRIQFYYTRYKIGPEKGKRRLEKSCLQRNGKPVFGYTKRPAKGYQAQMSPITSIPQDVQENLPVIYISAARSLKYQLPKSQNSLLGTLMEDINRDFENPSNSITINAGTESEETISRIDYFRYCISESIKALKTEEFDALEKSIKDNALQQLGFNPETEADKLDLFFNPLTSLGFYKSLEIFVNEYDYGVNATELGSGFQNAIVLAILKSFEERRKNGALFLIEEPEMYLHPQMQRSLYKTIRKIGETNQVIYITHSPNFVTIPEFDEISIICKNTNGTFATQSNMVLDDGLRNKFRKELNPNRNEMFFAKKVLIVEGDTEKLALPEFANRANIDLDQIGSSIIEVGGKRNLLDFIDIANSFNIPVAVAYDTDSSDFIGKKDDEKKYNALIDSYRDKGVEVFAFQENYESELKKNYGEKLYQGYCQKFGRNKTQRARLMAMDLEIEVPEFVKPIVDWLK
ncbi:ATP-dependent endonuclease [Flagellimonas aurea]|uniref:ATP-dependent nuclease n=1 Tax=Flagellimonas aurea TaxID=2915619 RepID=UPI0035CF05DB